MSLRLVRIDDRLIHGQVVAGWLRAIGGRRIVIVDDATPEPVIVLARSPRTILGLRQAGVPIEVVDLGGMGAGPGRKRIHKTISVSPGEIRELREIERLGTRVEIQIVVDDRPISFASVVSGE